MATPGKEALDQDYTRIPAIVDDVSGWFLKAVAVGINGPG